MDTLKQNFLVRFSGDYFFFGRAACGRPEGTRVPSLGLFMSHPCAIKLVHALHEVGFRDACVATYKGQPATPESIEDAELDFDEATAMGEFEDVWPERPKETEATTDVKA